jgi:hypothetical protein
VLFPERSLPNYYKNSSRFAFFALSFHFLYNCFCVPRERSFELLNKNSSSDCSFLLNK